jgi:hypothetical protein
MSLTNTLARVLRMPTALKVVFYLAVVPLEVLAAVAAVQLARRFYRRRRGGLTEYRLRKHALAPFYLDDLPNRGIACSKTHCLLGS